MKKITRLISFVAIFVATLGITVNAQDYCNDFGTTTSDETRGWSETVFTTLGVATTVDSKAEGNTTIVAGDTYRGVANESQPVVVYRGKSLKIDLIKGDSFNWIHFAGYADWNQDKTFEKLFYDGTNTNANRSYELEIPTDAKLGQTRIRILMGWFTQDTDPSKENYYSSCTIKQTAAEPVKNARVLDFLIDVQETTLPDAPTFSVPNGGVIVKGDVVTISSVAGTTIKYTTDGSDPATSTTAIENPSNSVQVTIDTDRTQVKAIALNSSAEASPEATATYRMIDIDMRDAMYYYVVFYRGGEIIALEDKGDGKILKTATYDPSAGENTAQMWTVKKGSKDGYYKLIAKSGGTLYFEPTEISGENANRFRAGKTPNDQVDMRFLIINNGYQIQRMGSTDKCMNPFGGSTADKEIAEYKNGDGGNVLNFKNKVDATSVKNAENTAYAVSVVDGVISVTGASAFDVYTLSGQRVNANRQLDKGVYIVKVNDFTQKVIVR